MIDEWIDTGRLRLEKYRGLLYCEAYMQDEFIEPDIQIMIDYINKYLNGLSDVILEKASNYSVSGKCQIRLSRGIKELRNFAYVADGGMKRDSAIYACKNYMANYNAQVFNTREEAYTYLVELSLNVQS